MTTNLSLSRWTNSVADIIGLTNLVKASVVGETNLSLVENFPIAISNNFKFGGASGSTAVSGVINPKTGVFTVTIGGGVAKTKGYGAILQRPLKAGGYFLTLTNAQAITLEP
jgi:hypothetical protein